MGHRTSSGASSEVVEGNRVGEYVLDLREVDRSRIDAVGGKGASLGELSRLEGICVPVGFCVTTRVFERVVGGAPSLGEKLDRLSSLAAHDRVEIATISADIRAVIEATALPDDVVREIARELSRLGEHTPCAVRSSATAEDLPSASFAGLQDTRLNVMGLAAVTASVRQCMASLFSERAVTYRAQRGFDQRRVRMAVVVQKMAPAQAAGTMFTADPISSNRRVTVIEAVFGLGESLASGLVNADRYKLRDGRCIETSIATKTVATRAVEGGGTQDLSVGHALRSVPVLTEAQAVELERLGRLIEAHFGQPQDVEWCLADGAFFIVQSRPVTTLFPVPYAGEGDRVFVSVGHQQMMTDAMRPLGISVFQMTAGRPMYPAGGRLFVDPSRELSSPVARAAFLDTLARTDPLIRDAIMTVLARSDFVITAPPESSPHGAPRGRPGGAPAPIDDDPSIVADLIARSYAAFEELRQRIETRSGVELLGLIAEDIQRMRQGLFDPRVFAVLMAAMNAASWINDHMMEWLGESRAADTLSQSVEGNVTSEMGIALLDVADAIRPHPEVISYLRGARDDGFFEGLTSLEDGPEARAALEGFFDRYGMRCAGEIDITRTRWSESPTTLVPLILSDVENFEAGEGRRRFEAGRSAASRKENELLARIAPLPDGAQKVDETRRMIHRLRTFTGYREFPKYSIVRRYWAYKQALLREADRLVSAGVIRARDDVFFLSFDELCEVVRTQTLDRALVDARRAEHERDRKLTPPRVITSEGEIISGAYVRSDLPAGALVGLAISPGVVEGRARVLESMAAADLAPGDILVTAFTDPSWTPLFVSIKALVTEVGGLMSHGAVIAREYGLTSVIGVVGATRLIKDGQRIRVNGTDGYVEILAREGQVDEAVTLRTKAPRSS